jgi:GH15 family glucan-1,4-alpha-glucosidase
MAERIEDYALIGDCETAVLVSRGGSMDWLCWPRFDSDACFAALLGTRDNGRWLIAPRDPSPRISRRYRGDTLILETTFETDQGAVTLTDFMPLRDRRSDIVRIVTGLRGQVEMHTELILRFGYGAIVPWVTRAQDGGIRAIAGPDMVLLCSSLKVHGENLTTVGDFTISAGQSEFFILTYAPSHLEAPKPVDPQQALRSTEKFWTDWSERCRGKRGCPEPVIRSLITLKALTYAPSGGIVAAPTTSLPEYIGGERNWDYRFCWLRDATLTLLALMNADYDQEAQDWVAWLARAVAGSPDQIQIMYGICGERRLTEWEVPWLPGHQNSRPVRIGNDAHRQLQIDVYGEVMDVFHQARRSGLVVPETGWDLMRALLQRLETTWREPDESIWEVRGPRRHFTYSKVMAWVAFDRAIKDAEQYALPGPVERWRQLRALIHEEVCQRGYNAEVGSFVQVYDGRELDGSLLLLSEVGFLPPQDPRIRGTVEAIERHLTADGFVLRYATETTDDGLPPGEGAFLACSFWLVDAYILLGRHDDARKLFKRLLGLCNDVGLISEEYDPRNGRLVGNFPQAFSHVSLVNSAFNLTAVAKPAKQRSEQAGPSGQNRSRQSGSGA